MAKRRKRFATISAPPLSDGDYGVDRIPGVFFPSGDGGYAISVHPGDLPELQYQPGYGSSAVPGSATTTKPKPTIPPHRNLEPHRSGIIHRQLQDGRVFGVPGIPPGTPGWAGNAGVAQSPHPVRGSRSGGPPPDGAVQTYGSLGYASMGDGSMDMAVRGARFSHVGSTSDGEETFVSEIDGYRQARKNRMKGRGR